MGYAFCMGHCVACEKPFSFNPISVPSIRMDGKREPICQSCVNLANVKRAANGIDPIVPAPDAYESCREEELN